MRAHKSFAVLTALLLALAIPAAAQSTQPVHKPAADVAHRSHSKHHAREPRGQMAPAADRITEIQSALIRENALTGDPTGIWDAATIEAMKRFQAAQNLTPTGKIDALTLQHLGLGSDVAGKGAPLPPLPPPPATPSASIQSDTNAAQ
jgi:peptidoglycan hydrolase-like protein with peptidoglycan-binding domain